MCSFFLIFSDSFFYNQFFVLIFFISYTYRLNNLQHDFKALKQKNKELNNTIKSKDNTIIEMQKVLFYLYNIEL